MARKNSERSGYVSSKTSGFRKTPKNQSVLTKPWLAEEDKIVLELRIVGWGWMAISKKLHGRSWAACRSRFHNHLIKQYERDHSKTDKLVQSYQRSKPNKWFNVTEQMAAPWRVAEAMHWQMGKQEIVRRPAVSSSPEVLLTEERTTNMSPRANCLPKLRMPIERGTVQLPSFQEMFSDVPSTRFTSK